MGLMSVAMVMVLTAVLLMTRLSSREAKFSEILADVTAIRGRVEAMVCGADAADTAIDEVGPTVLAFDDGGNIRLLDCAAIDPAGVLAVDVSRMEAYSTAICSFAWGDGDGCNFDILQWARTAALVPTERGFYKAIHELCGDDLSALPKLSVMEDGAALRVIFGGSAVTLRSTDPDVSAAFAPKKEGIVCTLSYKGLNLSSSFLLSLPPYVLDRKAYVLDWAVDAYGAADTDRNVQFAITDSALVLSAAGSESPRIACFVRAEETADYRTGFLRRDDPKRDLLLSSGNAPLELTAVNGIQFSLKPGLGVQCALHHIKNNADRSFDFLCPVRAAALKCE